MKEYKYPMIDAKKKNRLKEVCSSFFVLCKNKNRVHSKKTHFSTLKG